MSGLAEKFRAEVDRLDPIARKAHTDFIEARDAAVAEGVDIVNDGEAFKRLDELDRVACEHADRLDQAKSALMRAMEMEGRNGDAPPRPLETDTSAGKGGDELLELLRGGGVKTAGERLIESAEYKNLIGSGVVQIDGAKFSLPPVKVYDVAEAKAVITGLSDTSAGAFIINQRLPGYYELLQRQPQVASLFTNVETTVDVVEWVRETSFTNAAAEVAEATSTSDGLKPESQLALVVENTPVQQIAHYFNMTRRSFADAPQVRDLVNGELRRGIQLRLDTQLVNGNGTAPNLRGILNVSGIQTQARGTDSRADAVRKAVTLIRLAFMSPNAVLMHPSDVQTLVLEKTSNGDYYYGSPAQDPAASPRLWGLQIVESPVIAAGTAIVADWSQGYLFIRDGITILTSENVSDFFLRNIVTVLGEGRFALGVPRPAGFATVTGM